MDWVDLGLWIFAFVSIIQAGYYELFKDDDIKVIKHEVAAICFIVLYFGGQV